jgi:hypothetical protein
VPAAESATFRESNGLSRNRSAVSETWHFTGCAQGKTIAACLYIVNCYEGLHEDVLVFSNWTGPECRL